MSADNLQTVGVAALAFGILKVLEIAVSGLVKKKNGNGHDKNTAGEKPVEFWEKRFDKLDADNAALAKDLANFRVWIADSMTDIKSALSTLIRWKGGD